MPEPSTTTTTIFVPNTGNLILNDSFEELDENQKLKNWNVLTTGTFALTELEYFEGSKAGFFTSLTSIISGREIQSNIFEIDKTKNINISGYFKTLQDKANTKIGFKIYFFEDIEGKIPASVEFSYQAAASLNASNVWEEKKWTKLANSIPENAKYAKISIRFMYVAGIGTNKDNVYVDKINVSNE